MPTRHVKPLGPAQYYRVRPNFARSNVNSKAPWWASRKHFCNCNAAMVARTFCHLSYSLDSHHLPNGSKIRWRQVSRYPTRKARHEGRTLIGPNLCRSHYSSLVQNPNLFIMTTIIPNWHTEQGINVYNHYIFGDMLNHYSFIHMNSFNC